MNWGLVTLPILAAASAPVTFDALDLEWGVRVPVSSALDLDWLVIPRGPIGHSALDLDWRVRAGLAALDLDWNVLPEGIDALYESDPQRPYGRVVSTP